MTNEIRLDCKMCGLKMYDTKTTEVWFVLDDDEDSGMPNLWRTKMDAEIYARRMYPDESPDRRYARIYSEKIMSYDQQYCADELEEPNELS
jgi:hypothetical protein